MPSVAAQWLSIAARGSLTDDAFALGKSKSPTALSGAAAFRLNQHPSLSQEHQQQLATHREQ